MWTPTILFKNSLFRLSPPYWTLPVLDAMAAQRGTSLAQLIISIDRAREDRPLASACRVAALKHTQS